MKRIIFILLIFNVMLSCKSKDSAEDYIGNWLEVKQKENGFVIIDCGYNGVSLKIDNDSIFDKGIMENVDLKIDHIKQDESGVTLFIDKLEKSYYKFLWIDKEKGISKWEIKNDEFPIVIKFFVNKIKSNKIKTVKGSKVDCISNEDVGDVVNDSLVITDKSVLLIEDDNCISIKNSKGDFVFERCFENSIIKIRYIDTKGLPLTIINGQNSMDIEFFKKGNDWISNSVTYYAGSSNVGKKIKQIEISLREFDFNNVADQFGDENMKDLSSSLDDIKNKEKLMQLDIYKIADLLKANPISSENVALYNDAAFNLIQEENFNEARIILLEIVHFSPDRVVAYLNLGDAQWGFDENEEAKNSYKKYLSLMKSQSKDLDKVPKRVYERIK